MHRQSISSPGAKLHSHGGAKEEVKIEEELQKRRSIGGGTFTVVDEQDYKIEKSHRSTSSRPEKFIHLIPILTLLCLLVLYLCSHDPSQKDLPHFKAIRRPPAKVTDVRDFGRFLGLEKSGVLAIRSHRRLQVLKKKSRLHRKIGDSFSGEYHI